MLNCFQCQLGNNVANVSELKQYESQVEEEENEETEEKEEEDEVQVQVNMLEEFLTKSFHPCHSLEMIETEL